MKITIYELLGLIKDGKAPKKIVYDEGLYIFRDNDYYCNEYFRWFSQDILSTDNLNDEIEIIEEVEDKEYEDIEIISIDCEDDVRVTALIFTINALIRNQQKIINQLENK
jgi:hypothetical protein